ncbi:hypothetical protein LCGC14_1180940 [marine sediment metagenome]|uniref:Uncharacterized protein n=1 Tax=marine sediment metagenome TaxID=412755 RepID=A0A0F9LM79_9ZZZZ
MGLGFLGFITTVINYDTTEYLFLGDNVYYGVYSFLIGFVSGGTVILMIFVTWASYQELPQKTYKFYPVRKSLGE